MLVAVGVHLGGTGIAGVDALHAGLGQGQQFAGGAVTVAVGVLPDLEGGEGGVQGIHFAVVIAVEFGEGGETVGGFAAVGEAGFRTEEFGAAVDQAVAVEVAHQKGVVAPHPASLFGEAVVCMVEPGAGLH